MAAAAAATDSAGDSATLVATWLDADADDSTSLAFEVHLPPHLGATVTFTPTTAPGAAPTAAPTPATYFLAPGYLDMQFNGALGVDFSRPDITADAIERVLAALPAYGVTDVVPTLISSSADTYAAALAALADVTARQGTPASQPRARVRGIHLEGPFLAADKRGAHAPGHLRVPGDDGRAAMVATYSEVGAAAVEGGRVAVVTLAPELDGATALTAWLRRHGVVVAVGHTGATLEQCEAAVAAGGTMVTHLFNAMAYSHRQPGALGLLSTHAVPRPYWGIIADGAHVHPAAVSLAWQAHPRGVVLVTDAMQALGLPPGPLTYGDLAVTVHAGAEAGDGTYAGPHVVVTGTATLAGAVLPLDACVRNFAAYTRAPPAAAVAAASATPRRVLALPPVPPPTATAGAPPGSYVVLDASLHVVATIVDGVLAYRRPH